VLVSVWSKFESSSSTPKYLGKRERIFKIMLEMFCTPPVRDFRI
jgi:hypothetical protein